MRAIERVINTATRWAKRRGIDPHQVDVIGEAYKGPYIYVGMHPERIDVLISPETADEWIELALYPPTPVQRVTGKRTRIEIVGRSSHQ